MSLKQPTQSKQEQENETLARAVAIWIPLFVTAIVFISFKSNERNGIDIICFLLFLLNINWVLIVRNTMEKSTSKKYQIIIDGFLFVSMMICFQIKHSDWYVFGWSAAIFGLFSVLRLICFSPANK
jgi:hypothetical protein